MTAKEFENNEEVLEKHGVSREKSPNNSGGYNIDIDMGECQNASIVVNKDDGPINIYSDNPIGITHYDSIQDLFDTIIKGENKGKRGRTYSSY